MLSVLWHKINPLNCFQCLTLRQICTLCFSLTQRDVALNRKGANLVQKLSGFRQWQTMERVNKKQKKSQLSDSQGGEQGARNDKI